MLVDDLTVRAQRVAELQAMLEEDPGNKKAPDWIAEISRKALNDSERRHRQVVTQIRRLRKRVAMLEALPTDNKHLEERRDRLQGRLDAMRPTDKGYARFAKKLATLEHRIVNPSQVKRARIPALEAKIAELMQSPELITKEDANG